MKGSRTVADVVVASDSFGSCGMPLGYGCSI